MFDRLKNKANKVVNAVSDAVETKHEILVDGNIVKDNLDKKEVEEYLKNELKIEIKEIK